MRGEPCITALQVVIAEATVAWNSVVFPQTLLILTFYTLALKSSKQDSDHSHDAIPYAGPLPLFRANV